MPPKKDLTGKTFNHLTAITEIGKNSNGTYIWSCVCSCGNKTKASTSDLVRSNIKSCGCIQGTWSKTHGKAKTRIYRIWSNMKNRCTNKNLDSYKYYGGRGITVYDEWLKFENFNEWSMENGYDDHLTLDRVDNNKGYGPDNCRWASRSQQMNNTRQNTKVEINGENKTIAEWAEETNINYSTLYNRYWRGDRGEKLIRETNPNIGRRYNLEIYKKTEK